MSVDTVPVWKPDKYIYAITHTAGCEVCKSFRAHTYDALRDEDAGMERAIEHLKTIWLETSSVELTLLKQKHDELLHDHRGAREDMRLMERDLKSLERKYDEANDECKSLERELAASKEQVAMLEAQLASMAEDRARQ
jgi:septal ring factor EnvC (AmiA/AmiB activator)